MAECLKLKLLLKIARCWSVDEAAWVLEAFDIEAEEALIYWHRFWTDVATLQVAEPGAAYNVPVAFSGGPTKSKRYHGNFAMFVVDRVLGSGLEWDWLLHFNRNTTTHIKDQGLRKPGTLWVNDDEEEPPWDDEVWHNEYGDDDERASQFINVNGIVCPLNSEGRQVSQSCREPETGDDGTVRRWTSSGSFVGSEKADRELD